MIITRLSGGLGNQMFQYAAGYRLACRHGVPLKLDCGGFNSPAAGETPRSYALGVFNIAVQFANADEIATLTGPTDTIVSRITCRLRPVEKQSCYRERHFHFDPDVMRLGSNVYLDGYWQSERYFIEMSDLIRREFTLSAPLTGKNLQVAEQIADCCSVSLHVRRGDFVTNPTAVGYHGVCPPEYYRRALHHISQQAGRIELFIFSDDPQWVRDNMNFDCPNTFVEHNPPEEGHEDMRLMSLCRHNIIANSSFSWWGAWLNRNPGKLVVAPSRWFRKTWIDTSDLLPAEWHRI